MASLTEVETPGEEKVGGVGAGGVGDCRFGYVAMEAFMQLYT